MTRPEHQESNARVLRLAKRFVSLPFVVYGWVKRLTGSRKSEQTLRDEDQLRQSRARRELRGLPPDHVADSSKPL